MSPPSWIFFPTDNSNVVQKTHYQHHVVRDHLIMIKAIGFDNQKLLPSGQPMTTIIAGIPMQITELSLYLGY